MNIVTSKRELLRFAARTANVADKKSTMPILSNVLLTASSSELRLAATDLYQSLTGSVPADVATKGTMAVSAKDLVDRLKMLPDGPVDLAAKGDSLTLKSKGTARRYTMRAMAGEDFPPIPQPQADAPRFSVDAGTLTGLIALTHFSISPDESRAHLSAALLEFDGPTIRMVSTDGHRLSKAERTTQGTSAAASMLIPIRAVHEVRRMAEDIYAASEGERAITIVRSGPTAFFIGGGATFSVKLVDAQFPPWRQVIPGDAARTIRIARAALADALKAVSLAASEKIGGVKLSLSEGVLRISSESPDSGDGYDELPCDVVKGDAKALVGLNARYPLDVLTALGCEHIDMDITAELDPVVVRPAGDAPSEALFVIMPVRL